MALIETMHMAMQSLPEVVDADIEKDVGRTFPNSARSVTSLCHQNLSPVTQHAPAA